MPTINPLKLLPEPLRYLQPFIRFLAKKQQDELNEDINPSQLDSALRKRLFGMDEATASKELSTDRELLNNWLKTSVDSDHPAYWILGYLADPDLAKFLIRPPEPPRHGPKINFELPEGWTVKVFPFNLHFKAKGKKSIIGGITACDETQFKTYQEVYEQKRKSFQDGVFKRHWEQSGGPPLNETLETIDVNFGTVYGMKYEYKLILPSEFRSIDYLLTVPGGFAVAVLFEKGNSLDERAFESKLHTLYLIGLNSSRNSRRSISRRRDDREVLPELRELETDRVSRSKCSFTSPSCSLPYTS